MFVDKVEDVLSEELPGWRYRDGEAASLIPVP